MHRVTPATPEQVPLTQLAITHACFYTEI